ncbi:MAG: hypothetical protein A2167_05925 [Planctomycetes bacterium RBG_13_46_10]|nr:MAG: hypothetical protein A2167_05925 [Planctomycetes bacterium RBG_13_46_10]
MDKTTKQAHLLHALSFEAKNRLCEQIAKSISKNFHVPIDEAIDKCSVLITGLSIHILHLMIIEKMIDGELVAQKFLANIGKSNSAIKKIHETFGNLKIAPDKFKEMLEDYLGVPTNSDLSDWYYIRIKCSCESTIELVIKEVDNIELKNGALDFTDSAIQEKLANQIKSISDDLKNKKRLCPFCKIEGTFFEKFQFRGKDEKGFLYFECSNCKKHLQYDPIAEDIKTRKGLLGLLFGRFSLF